MIERRGKVQVSSKLLMNGKGVYISELEDARSQDILLPS